MAALRAAVKAIPNDDRITYDLWVNIGLAIHAASGGTEDGYGIFEDWSLDYGGDNSPDLIRDKWDSFKPKATGWNFLQRYAREFGFSGAKWEFGPADEEEADPASAAAAEDVMFAHSVWVERVQAVMDLRTFDLLNREQFNARHFRVGEPAGSVNCAWAVFLKKGDRRRSVKSVTYRPGSPLFVFEAAERGECVNMWRPTRHALPDAATAADAKPWLDHLAPFPDERERDLLIKWFAWVVQNPAKKPNWGVLVGSQHQGNGKSILTRPVRAALGDHNVREVTVEDLASGYTDWLAEAKLFIVEEMHSFERTSAMNRLKNFLAVPPYTLRVNPKFGKQFEVPNILAGGLFFTNHRNALALEKTDRRFLVLWTDVPPRDRSYYDDFLAWYDTGGAEKAARYLLDLDLGAFDALGRAPETPAKGEMRKQARSRLDEWIEDGMADGAEFGKGPFGASLVALEDLRQSIPEEIFGKTGRPSPVRFATAMRNAGAMFVDRIALGEVPRGVLRPAADLQQARLYSLRNHELYAAVDRAELPQLYWDARLQAQGGPMDVDRLFAAR